MTRREGIGQDTVISVNERILPSGMQGSGDYAAKLFWHAK